MHLKISNQYLKNKIYYYNGRSQVVQLLRCTQILNKYNLFFQNMQQNIDFFLFLLILLEFTTFFENIKSMFKLLLLYNQYLMNLVSKIKYNVCMYICRKNFLQTTIIYFSFLLNG
jgi:hypothetical protein